MGKKRNRRDHDNNDPKLIQNNIRAITEGPTKKKWTKHDLKNVKPMTEKQSDIFRAYFEGSNICAHGSAGTGKTFLATYLAMNDILAPDQKQQKVKFIRSIVPTRDIGFLPGTIEEKTEIYELPYKDILHELFGKASTYDNMKRAGMIEFVPTSYVRGRTWDDSIIIVDEMQNMTDHEIDSIMTRLGTNSRIIATGDLVQSDLNKSSRDKCGMDSFLQKAAFSGQFSTIQLGHDDIVRSKFVKDWIIACEKFESQKNG